jgi:DNA adenine methylase
MANSIKRHQNKQLLAKPFLKWAGGKTQLLSQIQTLYPPDLIHGTLTNYVEPFIGGGAVFFDVVQKYGISSAFLYDINPALIIVYTTIKKDLEKLIEKLIDFSEKYKILDENQRKDYFYQIRDQYNIQRQTFNEEWITRTAQLIFLNRTCFNGLFRLNKQGDFNVPYGRYKNPKIVDEQNLTAVSHLLQIAEIKLGDFQQCQDHINSKTFVYFDPPYRPLNATARFTAYSTFSFDDKQQRRLGKFFAEMNELTNAKMMLSNSDPKNEDPNDNFFDVLYQDFTIHRVAAKRMINSNAKRRGTISEIIVTNYDHDALSFGRESDIQSEII